MNSIDLENLADVFAENFVRHGEVGAALSLWQGGKEVTHLFQGYRDGAKSDPWQQDTLVLIWSATKGPAAASVLHALDRAGLDLPTPVSRFWPGFARNGKAEISVGQVLSHQAGLAALDSPGTSMLDHDGVVAALEEQEPNWSQSGLHGYGPRTFGFLADEIVRRLAGGVPLGTYWREQIADPLDFEIWIGLPETQHNRVASILPPRASCQDSESPFLQAMADARSLTRRAFAAPAGLPGISSMNGTTLRKASLPSLGGIASARGLAKFYASLAFPEGEAGVIFSPRMRSWMEHPLVQGDDLVLRETTAFSAGFMKDPIDPTGKKLRTLFGPSRRAFGHPGAGGSLAFADPENGVGFAYVMNQMGTGALPSIRGLSLMRALYAMREI